MDERIALVTGGTGGLGRHVVAALIQNGIHVHVPWIDEDEVPDLEDHLGDPAGSLYLHPADVTEPDEVDALVQEVEKGSGRPPDILCNLVGAFAFASVEATDPELWDTMMTRNARSAFLCSRATLGGMRGRGWGRIVNVCAFPALLRGEAGLAAYSASKSAVLNFTYTLAKETVGEGITVNAVVPKIIDTPGNREAMPDADFSSWVPPEEIARVISFLVGDGAPSLTGAALTLTRD